MKTRVSLKYFVTSFRSKCFGQCVKNYSEFGCALNYRMVCWIVCFSFFSLVLKPFQLFPNVFVLQIFHYIAIKFQDHFLIFYVVLLNVAYTRCFTTLALWWLGISTFGNNQYFQMYWYRYFSTDSEGRLRKLQLY